MVGARSSLRICTRTVMVSIVNALAIKSFGQSELSRTKTDKADAALITRYCVTMHPAPWEPPSPVQQRLKRLARRRVALDEMGFRSQIDSAHPARVTCACRSRRPCLFLIARSMRSTHKSARSSTTTRPYAASVSY